MFRCAVLSRGAVISVVASIFGCLGSPNVRADIVISEDDWDNFTERSAGSPPMDIVTTEDDRKSLHVTRPSGDKSIIYQINVTKLPGGESRFPVEVISRQVMDCSNGFTIRNLTIDPEPDPNLQNSFVSILMNDGGAGGPALARDERWVDFEGEDPAGTIGMSGLRVEDPTADTGINPDDATTTSNATLELELGVNILRLDPTDPRDLPAYMPDCGSQIFTLTIGPGEPDLQGELVVHCAADRAISPSSYSPGDTVSVTVSAKNIAGATTITETFPAGWSVTDNGGGTVNANTIVFTLDADGDVTYGIAPPAGFCEVVEIAGNLAGAGGCDAEVAGDKRLRCVEQPTGGLFFDFDDTGPTAEDELLDFFTFLGFEPQVGTNWTIQENFLSPDPSQALRTNSDGNQLMNYFSRVAIITDFEAENVEISADITWDDNDSAGLYVRFVGDSDDPHLNDYYFVRGEANGSAGNIHLHRVKEGAHQELAAGGPAINQGDTLKFTVRAVEDRIYVLVNDELIPGMDPFVDPDPILDAGQVGVGQETNPGYYDNIAVVPESEFNPFPCVAQRVVSPVLYAPGDTVSVTVTATNIAGATTITETFPSTWTVSNAGGGTVAGNSIAFNLNADGDVTYELTVPAGFCEAASLEGAIAGAGGCDGEVTGVAELVCLGTGGIRITGDDWEDYLELDVDTPGTTPVPEIVETEDGMIALHLRGFPPDGADNDMFATYRIVVTQLPGGGPGPERFPITAVVRNVGGNAGMAIRNLTVAPIDERLPFPENIAQQASFACVGIHADLGADVRAMGTGPQPFDPCLDQLVEDPAGTIILEPWGNSGEIVGVSPVTATDAPGAEIGILQTVDVMVDLVLGENILRIDSTDVRDLPCQYLGESGHELFTLIIGANEPDLKDDRQQPPPVSLRPGDVNLDGQLNITDPVSQLGFLFGGQTFPECLANAESGQLTEAGMAIVDFNGDGNHNITDPVGALGFLFSGGSPHALGDGCALLAGDCVSNCQ